MNPHEDLYKKVEKGEPISASSVVAEGLKPEFVAVVKAEQNKILEEAAKLDRSDTEGTKKLFERFAFFSELEHARKSEEALLLIDKAFLNQEISEDEYKKFRAQLIPQTQTIPEPVTSVPELEPMAQTPERPERTPEELRAEAVKELAYRLKTGNLSGNLQEFQQKTQGNPLENPPPSEALKNATSWWLDGREILLKAYEDKARLIRDIARLKKEIAAKAGQAGVAGREQGELDWLENQRDSIDIDSMQARLRQLQEHLKVRLMDDFRDDKGAFIRANFENIFRNKYPGQSIPADPAEKERAIKTILEQEVKNRLKGAISDTIYIFDDSFNKERERRIAEFQERTRVQKLLEAWNNMPLYKRLAISAVIAGGVGAFALPMLPVVGGLFSVKGGLAATFAYRGARSAVGGATAFAANKFAQWLGRNAYKKERGKLREERMESAGTVIEQELANAQNWLENEAAKLELAKIADHFVDEQRKGAERLNKKEADRRRYLAIFTGVAAGAWSGLALDAATGGDIFGAPKRAKGWFGKLFGGGEEVPPSVSKGVTPPPGLAVAPPEVDSVPGARSDAGLADAPGGMDVYPAGKAPYAGGYGDQPPGGVDAAPVPGIEWKMTVQPGDKVWTMTDKQFHGRFGDTYDQLSRAQKENVIANFLQENGSRLGLEDINKIRVGQEIDFSEAFKNPDEVRQFIARAHNLTPEQIKNIESYFNRPKTSGGAGGGTVLETTPDGTPKMGDGEYKSGVRPGVLPEQWAEGATSKPEPTGPELEPAPGRTAETAGGDIDGGGIVLNPEPIDTAPRVEMGVTTMETSFGSKLEQAIAETGAGFSAEEYKLLRGVTVDQLLKQIPEGGTEQADMWRNFSAGQSWPDLPHTKSIIPGISDYKSSELLKQVSLADAIYKLEPNQAARNLTVEQFINQFGDRLDIKKSLLSRFGI